MGWECERADNRLCMLLPPPMQEAERRIPVNYSSRYSAGALARQSYLPFKVNATGVMPLIFASSLLALPSALARYTDAPALDEVAKVREGLGWVRGHR